MRTGWIVDSCAVRGGGGGGGGGNGAADTSGEAGEVGREGGTGRAGEGQTCCSSTFRGRRAVHAHRARARACVHARVTTLDLRKRTRRETNCQTPTIHHRSRRRKYTAKKAGRRRLASCSASQLINALAAGPG